MRNILKNAQQLATAYDRSANVHQQDYKISSFCDGGGCVAVSHKTSSFCGGGECVAVSKAHDETILVFSSVQKDGPKVEFTREEWRAFVLGVKNNEFDF